MLDICLLKQVINDSGYKKTFIAERIGISYQAFLNKIEGRTEFVATEIVKFCDLLQLDNQVRDKIFFTKKVDKTSTK